MYAAGLTAIMHNKNLQQLDSVNLFGRLKIILEILRTNQNNATILSLLRKEKFLLIQQYTLKYKEWEPIPLHMVFQYTNNERPVVFAKRVITKKSIDEAVNRRLTILKKSQQHGGN